MHPNLFSFGSTSVISKVSVAGFEHVFVYLERYFRIKTTLDIVLILETFTPKTNNCSKSATETIRQELKSVES